MNWVKIVEEFFDTLNGILRKMLSVRAIVTVIVVVTLCLAVFKCLDLLTTTMGDEEQFNRVKDVIMYLLGAFTALVSMSTTAYFGRSDRWRSNKEENGKQKQ